MQGVLPLAVCERLCDALSKATTLDQVLSHINSALQSVLGPGLLTVNLVAHVTPDGAGDAPDAPNPPGEVLLERLWTSDPVSYPVSGRKRKTLTPWTHQLLLRAEVFTGEGDAALAAVFDDHARIASLGLHAVINVPLVEAGRCVATFNLLGTRPQWLQHEIASVRLLALLAAPWVLQARRAAYAKTPGTLP